MEYKLEITNDIRKYCSLLVLIYKDTLKNEGKEATGKLINDAKCYAEINGQYVEIWFQLHSWWKYVENGRRAGAPMPPISAILDWIRVKHIAVSSTGKAKTTLQLAFVIAKSISEKGIAPTKALDSTMKRSDPIIDKIVENLKNQISAVVDEDLKQAVSE